MTKREISYKEINKKNVVYSIVNTVDSKLYIGSTNAFYKRKSAHLKALEKNKHHSILLQRSYNKYGLNVFEFDILEVLNNEEDVLFYEQKWINLTQCFLPRFGYNILSNVIVGAKGRIMGLKEKQMRSEKMKEVCSQPGYKEKMSIYITKSTSCPEYRKRLSVALIGMSNPKKLTKEKVGEIHELIALGEKQKTIAAKFNVDPSLISRISSKTRWINYNRKNGN